MHRYIAVAVLAAFFAGVSARPLAAQSLADVAKKEEERRKEIKQPSKVITNTDLKDPGVVSAQPAAAPATPAAATPEKDATKDDAKDKDKGPAKDQAYWSGRLKSLQQALDRDQQYADAMQTKVNSLNTDFVNRDDPAQRAVIERDRQKSIAELGRLKDQIVKDKKAIDDLQEEARRAGVPPGWLR